MDQQPVVEFERVTKEYRIAQERSNARSLIPGRWGEPAAAQTFRALDDVSFQLDAGDTLGLIGHNGAGKSTLLRVLAGIVEPSRGRVSVNGRFASLIELGIGFDEELTGRENVFFAGDLMGMTKADIRSRFDDIVGFAGVEAFLDMPVKRYSTGMRARLGFSVATSVEADVLLVDEVLSVGDFEFQRRSLERIRAMCDGGAALILVSHNLWSINSLCSRALLLDHGRVLVDGTPAEAIDRYMAELGVTELDPERGASFEEFEVPEVLRGRVVIEEIEALPPVIRSGDPVTIRAVINVVEPCDAVVVMSLFTSERAVYAERELGPDGWAAEPGRYVVEAAIEAVPLSPGRFQFRVAVLPEDDRHLDQEFPRALDVATTEVEIAGDLTARPGIRLGTRWTVAASAGAD
ncbi:MAG: ABC transporter ATP-binding protein [Microthrixaceae bacterium]